MMIQKIMRLVALCALLALPAVSMATPVTVASTAINGWRYPGTTASIRIYADTTFVASDYTIVVGGAVGSKRFFQEVSCTVNGSTHVLTIPAFTIQSTTDTPDGSIPHYTFVFTDAGGIEHERYATGFAIPVSFGANATWGQLFIYNTGTQPIRDQSTYTKDQVDAIAAGVRGLTQLNGIPAISSPSQNFLTGSIGSNFSIVSSGSTHTFFIPSSSATARGLLTASDWSSFNSAASRVNTSSTINPKASPYNAQGDGKVRTDCSMTLGSTTLTCTAGQFLLADVGKVIEVYGAGPLTSGYRQSLSTTIAARLSATAVTLAAAASVSVTNSSRVVYGTDDTAALQAAVDALAAPDGNGSNIGGTLDIPAGIFLTHGINMPTSIIGVTCYGTSTKTYNNITIRGAGTYLSVLENWDVNTDTGGSARGAQPLALISVGGIASSIYVGQALGGCYANNKNVSGIVVRDLSLRPPKYSTQVTRPLHFENADDVQVYNIWFTGDYEGMYGKGYRWQIHDNYADSVGFGGPAYSGTLSAYNLFGFYVEAYNNYATNCGQGFEAGGHHQNIHDNHIIGGPTSGYGMNIGSTSSGIWEVEINRNIIEGFGSAIFVINVNGMLSNIRVVGNTIKNGSVQMGAGKLYNAVADEWDEPSAGREKGLCVFNDNTLIFDSTFAGTPGITVGSTTDVSYPTNSYQINGNSILFKGATSPIVRLNGAGLGTGWTPNAAVVASTVFSTQPSFVVPIIRNGYAYRCTTSGTTGTSEPVWPTTIGATVADGTAVWTNYDYTPHIHLSGLAVSGPSNFNDVGAFILNLATSASRQSIHVSNVQANYRWRLQGGSVAIDVENLPPNNNGSAAWSIPADAIYSDNEGWLDLGTNGSGDVQNQPWAGFWQLGTKLWRVHPAAGAGGLGMIVSRSGYAARPWGATRAYSRYGMQVVPTVDNAHFYYNVSNPQSCTTGGSEPTWPTGSGATVVDGTCTWKEAGVAVQFISFP